MEEITIFAARDVLQKLVRERKALELGLEAANVLSEIVMNDLVSRIAGLRKELNDLQSTALKLAGQA